MRRPNLVAGGGAARQDYPGSLPKDFRFPQIRNLRTNVQATSYQRVSRKAGVSGAGLRSSGVKKGLASQRPEAKPFQPRRNACRWKPEGCFSCPLSGANSPRNRCDTRGLALRDGNGERPSRYDELLSAAQSAKCPPVGERRQYRRDQSDDYQRNPHVDCRLMQTHGLLALCRLPNSPKESDHSEPKGGKSQRGANPSQSRSIERERDTKFRQTGPFTG